MHGAAPLARSVVNLVSQSQSKIPHLRCHIVLRQGRTRPSQRDATRVSAQQNRYQTTFVPSTYSDEASESYKPGDEVTNSSRVGFAPSQETVQERHLRITGDSAATSSSVNMYEILEEGLPDRILSGLMSDSVGTPFLQEAHNEDFNKALLTLDPAYFIEPYKDVSRHLYGRRERNVLEVKNINERLSTFSAYLDRIVAVRREAGKTLDAEACNHLLKCAASMGDKQLAGSILNKIMSADGIEPTLQSYNHYGAAMVWSHAFSSLENYNLRTTPSHLRIRSHQKLPRDLSGHNTSNPAKWIAGIRAEVLEIFKASISKGYEIDETMFTNLMLAMGREADIGGVKSILKSVWNVDVDMLGVYDEEELESPTFYEKDHHLRPSERLLFTVAHIFGSNSDIATASLLVDFISRNYDLTVSKRVWMELCEWSFVLSVWRSKSTLARRGTGQIPQQTFTKMLEAMTDAPHNIEPDAFVHYLLSRSWRDRNMLHETAHHVQKLEEFVRQQLKTVNALKKRIMGYTEKALSTGKSFPFETKLFYDLRHQYMLEFHELQRQLQFMNIAVNRTLLGHNKWPGSRKETDWARRGLPRFVDLYQAYLPEKVTYQTTTGQITLHTREKRRLAVYHRHNTDLRVFPTVMNALDTEDQSRLIRRMTALSKLLVTARRYCYNCEKIGHSHDQCPDISMEPWSLNYAGESRKPHGSDGSSETTEPEDEDEGIVVREPHAWAQLASELSPPSSKLRRRPSLPFL